MNPTHTRRRPIHGRTERPAPHRPPVITLCLLSALTLCLAHPEPAQAQLGQVELALKLRSKFGKGKFIFNSPKYLTHYNDCRARGESDAQCKSIVALCAAQEQPFFGGPYASLFRGLGLNQVFKIDCGNQECFQCCHVPGQGCHTSFIGFPVINCNENYGAGTNAAGLTLVVDPNAQPGQACLTTPQTCEHIARCATEDPQTLRDTLDSGGQHPVNAPGAAGNRAKFFAQQVLTDWCGGLDVLHTGLPDAGEGSRFERIVDVENFLTGRGCVGWRQNVAAVFPFDWQAEAFVVRDEAGAPLPLSSQRNALCQWGLFRVLESVPNLGERLSFIDSTVWPDAARDAYLAQVDDPDQALLQHADPIVLDLLRRNTGVSDYRLLAVPLPGELPSDGVFNGCDLGEAPRVFLDTEPAGPDRIRIHVEVRDPEAGTEHAGPIPLTVFWGDGRVSLEELGQDQGPILGTFEHSYAQGGRYHIIVLGENTSGLRGFGAAIGETGTRDPGVADGPIVVSEVRLVDTVIRADTLTGNDRTFFLEIEGHDTTDATHRIGLSAARPIGFNTDIALGTLVGHNTGAAPLDRIILRPFWYDGFYTGLSEVFLRINRLELHVFSTETGDTLPVELPLDPSTLRLYAEGQEAPLAPELLVQDDQGQLKIPLHTRDHLIERIEIDLPQPRLAAAAPGPLPDGFALTQTSWFEERPEHFIAVGRDPDMGPPDPADAGPSDPRDGGVSDRGQSDLGDLPGDATPTPGASGGGGGCTLDPAPTPHLGWLALLLLLTLRRRRP